MAYSKELELLSDEEILRLSQRNPDAFEALVVRYEEAFLRKAKNILYSKEDAEEVVQDTFTRIYIYADRFKPQEGASFSSWAYAILIRLCYTRYAKMKKARERTQDLEPETYERLPDAGNFLEDLSVRSEVLAALSKLPETAARILRLQFIEGKTQDEIATLEGSSVPAVKTRVHRAKNFLNKPMTNNVDMHSVISRNVMRRIRFVHAIRPFMSNAAGAIALLTLSLYTLGREVFVAQVFRNMPSADIAAVLRFTEAAFLNTTFVVQALTLVIAIGGVWLARECVRLVSAAGTRFA